MWLSSAVACAVLVTTFVSGQGGFNRFDRGGVRCFTTVEGGPVKSVGLRCQFPFIFRGREFSGCTTLTDPDDKLWCSTRVNPVTRKHIGGGKGNWGYCDDSCAEDFGILVRNRTITTTTTTTTTTRPRPTPPRPRPTPPRPTRPRFTPTFPSRPVPRPRNFTQPALTVIDSRSGKWLPDLEADHSQCGVSFIPGFLVGGYETSRGQFPFMALLGYPGRGSLPIVYKCGGTLINRRYVVTAAHCHHRTLETRQIKEVVLGEFEVGKDPDCFDCPLAQRYTISPRDVTMHEKYSASRVMSEANDIALVRLPHLAITFQENDKHLVMPICLPWKRRSSVLPSDVSGQFFIAGWGKATQQIQDRGDLRGLGVFERRMRFAHVPIVPYERCRRFSAIGGVHSERHVCAGGDAGVDSCNGDSGGPLFGRKGRGSLMILRGIVSYGTKRCGIGVPGVYTDVYHYITWITQNMRP